MARSVQDWIEEGDQLHAAALRDLAEMEAQITDLEQRRTAKLAELNQISGIMGKLAAASSAAPAARPAEPRATVHMADGSREGDAVRGESVRASSVTIARALAGKGLVR